MAHIRINHAVSFRQRSSIVAALALLLVGMLLAACGGEAQRASVGPTSPAVDQPAQAQIVTATATVKPRPTVAVTRTPARTPTPIPPPVPAIGDVVETDGWKLAILGFDLFQRVGASRAEGTFLYLRLSIQNVTAEPRAFPFTGLVVTDLHDNSYFLHEAATRETMTYDYGIDMDSPLAPGDSRSVAAAFDIASDATGLVLTTPSRVFKIRVEYDATTK